MAFDKLHGLSHEALALRRIIVPLLAVIIILGHAVFFRRIGFPVVVIAAVVVSVLALITVLVVVGIVGIVLGIITFLLGLLILSAPAKGQPVHLAFAHAEGKALFGESEFKISYFMRCHFCSPFSENTRLCQNTSNMDILSLHHISPLVNRPRGILCVPIWTIPGFLSLLYHISPFICYSIIKYVSFV